MCESVKVIVFQKGIILNSAKNTLYCNECFEYYEFFYILLIQIIGHY